MYQLPMFADKPGLMHGFSTRADGNQRYGLGDPKWRVIQNRSTFLQKVHPTETGFLFRISVGMLPFQQGLEEEIVIVGPVDAGRGMVPENNIKCEALVTNTPDMLLFCHFGDCIPIILYDQRRRVLALVHGGRESTIRRLPEKTLGVMKKKFHTDPSDVIVGMGPGFRSHSVERLPSGISDPIWNAHIRQNEHRAFFMNLFGYNNDRLIASGVPEENVEECPYDTYTCTDYFSHRRSAETGEKEGRHACAVGMVG